MTKDIPLTTRTLGPFTEGLFLKLIPNTASPGDGSSHVTTPR